MAPQSALVEQIRLALIKMVTANPRLVVGQFDEQTRKQFAKNKPEMNPFGNEEDVRSFRDMDLFTKVFTKLLLHLFFLLSFAMTLICTSGEDPCAAPTFCMDLHPPTPDA